MKDKRSVILNTDACRNLVDDRNESVIRRPGMQCTDAGMYSSDTGLYGATSVQYNTALSQRKPSVLLHACCGPCSTSCVERLAPDYSITVFYYNPNITDREEYYLRRDTLLQFIRAFNEEHKDLYYINYLEGDYDTDRYLAKCGPLADEPEGGARCDLCFALRLAETARIAGEMEIDYFTTTMSVSPHKNYEKIRTLGLSLEEQTSSRFLDIDFKKKNGFGRSVEMSRQYGLYRQNFCGCEFARCH